MVYEVSSSQQLSQTNVKTLSQRCEEVILRASCIKDIRDGVIVPVLEYYKGQSPPRTLASDAVFLAWRLLRQGTMPCMLLNNFRSGILEKFNMLKVPPTESSFVDAEAKENIKIFLGACKDDLYMTDDQIFLQSNLYTDDTNTLNKAIAIIETFFVRIGKIQGVNYAKKIAELQATNPLFSLEETAETEGQVPQQDLRLRVLKEFLETEQKYVADLDKLQSYAEELRMDKVISVTAHKQIFANLDELVDFQRRFLMQMESSFTKNTLKDINESYKANVADLFRKNEKDFAVYETFCPNSQNAAETVEKEMDNLMSKARVMDPNTVLNSYLIKPTQRICKYPLLIRELIKQSSADAPDKKDLEEAFSIVNRVTLRVNEKKRRAEMDLWAEELSTLIKDWKGMNIKEMGQLKLKDTAVISMGDSSKELELYLFEKVLLMCGKSKALMSTKKGTFVIKGFIYLDQIISVMPTVVSSTDPSTFGFKMNYRNVDIEYCTVNFKMEEKVKTWVNTMKPLVEAAKAKKEVSTAAANITPASAKDRRRKSLLTALLPTTTTPTAAPNANAVQSTPLAPVEEEPMRLKIYYDEDIFVTCIFQDIQSLQALKEAAVSKVKASYSVLGKEVSIKAGCIDLEYVDEDKDWIKLLDSSDVDTALTFSPHRLTIKIIDKA